MEKLGNCNKPKPYFLKLLTLIEKTDHRTSATLLPYFVRHPLIVNKGIRLNHCCNFFSTKVIGNYKVLKITKMHISK